jgi:hypothetical protein
LARACFSGSAKPGVIVFSDHRGVVDDATAARARDEYRSNLDWLASESGASIVDHTDLLLSACRGEFLQSRERIYHALEQLRDQYDLVVTHMADDTNQDHRQIAEEAIRVFKAHSTVLSGEFPANDVGKFVPHVFVSLSEREIRAKATLIGRYRSQQFGGRPYFDEQAVLGLAHARQPDSRGICGGLPGRCSGCRPCNHDRRLTMGSSTQQPLRPFSIR